MKRDFSNVSKERILRLISNVEGEKFSDISDWIDGRWEYQSWIGKLHLNSHFNEMNVYRQQVIYKNSSSKKKIEKIFSDAASIDASYQQKMMSIKSALQKWDTYMIHLNRIINPNNGSFSVKYIRDSLNAIRDVPMTPEELRNLAVTKEILKNCVQKSNNRQISIGEFLNLYNTLCILEYLGRNSIRVLNFLNGSINGIQKNPKEYIEAFEEITGSVSFFSEVIESSEVGAICSIGSLLLDIAKAGDPNLNKTPLERTRTVLNIFKDGIDSIKDIFSIANLGEDVAPLGVIGSSIGIYSELTKAPERSGAEQLKLSGELASKGGNLAKNIFELSESGKAVYKNMSEEAKKTLKLENTNNLNAIATMISMGTRAVGNILQYSSDGSYDIEDYGDTLLDTGVAGMSSLINLYTYGFVDIDAERSVAVYDQAIKKTQDIIKSTGAPVPVQVVLAIPGTVIASAVGTVGTFIDYGMQIGYKFVNVFT